MRLPNLEHATIPKAKITEYLLSNTHLLTVMVAVRPCFSLATVFRLMPGRFLHRPFEIMLPIISLPRLKIRLSENAL